MSVITGTGFHGDGRRQVRKAAEAAGAEYSGDLQKDVTTHLVVSETAGAAASAKLQRAAEWGIPSLQWAWLKQSAARGRLMPTGLYLYSGAEPSSSDAAKRPQTPFQDSAPAADGAAQRSPAVLPSTSAEDRLQQHKRCDTAACAARANASSSAFATAGSHSEERPAAGQDNLTPQPHSATAAPHSYSPERAADQAEALAAELQGLQVRSSPLDRGALASIQHASDRQLLDEPLAAAPSQAGSCMCSAGSDDDGIHCAQGAPASGDHRGTPLKLPSPAQQRRSDAGMRADVAGPQSPEASISAAAAASPGVDTKSHMVPSTVASSSQDLWSSPPAGSVRRMMPLRPSPSVHLPGRATPGHKASDGGAVVALKVLARPPRGNTVCEHHGLGRKQLQHVQFAEQVQVVGAGMVLSTKDRKVAAVVQPLPPPADADDPDAPVGGASTAPPPVLAEIRSLYCMPSGEYWCEYCRYFTADDIDDMAAECGRPIPLTDFNRRHELLKGIERIHCPVADIREQKRVRHSKQVGPMRKNDGGGLFWRSCFDTELKRCVTDAPAAIFMA